MSKFLPQLVLSFVSTGMRRISAEVQLDAQSLLLLRLGGDRSFGKKSPARMTGTTTSTDGKPGVDSPEAHRLDANALPIGDAESEPGDRSPPSCQRLSAESLALLDCSVSQIGSVSSPPPAGARSRCPGAAAAASSALAKGIHNKKIRSEKRTEPLVPSDRPPARPPLECAATEHANFDLSRLRHPTGGSLQTRRKLQSSAHVFDIYLSGHRAIAGNTRCQNMLGSLSSGVAALRKHPEFASKTAPCTPCMIWQIQTRLLLCYFVQSG